MCLEYDSVFVAVAANSELERVKEKECKRANHANLNGIASVIESHGENECEATEKKFAEKDEVKGKQKRAFPITPAYTHAHTHSQKTA